LVSSPKPPRDPPLEKKVAEGVSVSTNTLVHMVILEPSFRAACPKNQSSDTENPGCSLNVSIRNFLSYKAMALCVNV